MRPSARTSRKPYERLVPRHPLRTRQCGQLVDWDAFTLERVASELREELSAPEAERMVYAFESALRVARVDPELLPHLLAATACLLAHSEATTPRDVLETFFRRAVADPVWRERYEPLFE